MNAQKLIGIEINKLDNEFNKLLKNDKLNISEIESLSINTVEECKQIINNHIERLVMSKIDEQQLISKKNKNGKKMAALLQHAKSFFHLIPTYYVNLKVFPHETIYSLKNYILSRLRE